MGWNVRRGLVYIAVWVLDPGSQDMGSVNLSDLMVGRGNETGIGSRNSFIGCALRWFLVRSGPPYISNV